MKNKFLKTLGVSALCLTSAFGLVACGGKTDENNYQKVDMTKAEAIQMYQTAYDAYRYDADGKGEFMGSFWAGFELEVEVKLDFSDEPVKYTLKFQRGKVDGKETVVEYENENWYHVYQTIDNETCMMWQRSDEGGDVKTTESADIVWTDSDLTLFADENEDFFWEAKKDSNNNYILTYINIEDKVSGDDPTKTWKEITTHEYYINSNGRFTKCVVREETGNFKGMSAEEIADTDYSGTYTFTFNSNKKFDETWVKGLMTNVEERADNL